MQSGQQEMQQKSSFTERQKFKIKKDIQKSFLNLVCITSAIISLETGFLPAHSTIMIQQFDLQAWLFAMIGSVSYIGIGISALYSSKLYMKQKLMTKTILVFSFIGLGTCQIFFSLLPTWWLKALFRFVYGIFCGPLITYFVIRVRLFSGKSFYKWVYIFNFYNALGFIIGFSISFGFEMIDTQETCFYWVFLAHGLIIYCVAFYYFKLTNKDLDIRYIKMILRKELIFDEKCHQPKLMERQILPMEKPGRNFGSLSENMQKESIKFRLKNIGCYEGFSFQTKKLFAHKIYLFALMMNCFRNMSYYAIIFWFFYELTDKIQYKQEQAYLISIIFYTSGLFIGYSVGFGIQNRKNLRSKLNIYSLIIVLFLDFLNQLILSILIGINEFNKIQVCLQIGFSLASDCFIYPFIQGFIPSQLPKHLKIFSVGHSISIISIFGSAVGPLLGVISDKSNLYVVFIVLTIVQGITFFLSFLFRGFIKERKQKLNYDSGQIKQYKQQSLMLFKKTERNFENLNEQLLQKQQNNNSNHYENDNNLDQNQQFSINDIQNKQQNKASYLSTIQESSSITVNSSGESDNDMVREKSTTQTSNISINDNDNDNENEQDDSDEENNLSEKIVQQQQFQQQLKL